MDCMLLSVIEAGGLTSTPAALRARIADAIEALDDAGRETIVRDIVEPARAASLPAVEILGSTAAGLAGNADREAFERWARDVRRGGKMLGAPELHVLKSLLAEEGLIVSETSVRHLRECDELDAWARKQTDQAPGRVALLATDGTHYNWVHYGPDSDHTELPAFRERRVRPGAQAATVVPGPKKRRRLAPCEPPPAPCEPTPVQPGASHRANVAAACALGAIVLVGIFVLSRRPA